MEKSNIQKTGKFKKFFDQNSSLVTLAIASIALIIFGTIAHPAFMTFGNWSSIITGLVAVGTMGAGLTVSMMLGGLDVSQYSILAFAGMLFGIIVSPICAKQNLHALARARLARDDIFLARLQDHVVLVYVFKAHLGIGENRRRQRRD